MSIKKGKHGSLVIMLTVLVSHASEKYRLTDVQQTSLFPFLNLEELTNHTNTLYAEFLGKKPPQPCTPRPPCKQPIPLEEEEELPISYHEAAAFAVRSSNLPFGTRSNMTTTSAATTYASKRVKQQKDKC